MLSNPLRPFRGGGHADAAGYGASVAAGVT